MSKSPDAFRTISEVADWLGVQAHVLRFWESKFAQVKPIKRAGGRRYYRPADMLLIGGIKKLLHDDGLTIKGAQKILREQGVAYVADLSQPLDDLTMAVIEGSAEPALADRRDTAPEKDVEATEAKATAALDDEVLPDDPDDWTPEDLVHRRRDQEEDEAASEALAAEYAGRAQEQNSRDVASQDSIEDAVLEEDADPAPVAEEASQTPSQPEESAPEPGHLQQGSTEEAAAPESPTPEPDQAHPALSDGLAGDEESLPGFLRHPLKTEEVAEQETAEVPGEEPASDGAPDTDDVMPSFSARPRSRSSQPEARPAETPQEDITQADAPQSEARKPRNIELPPLPVESAMPTAPSALSALTRQPKFDADQARELRPLLARLIRHKASLASPRKEARKD